MERQRKSSNVKKSLQESAFPNKKPQKFTRFKSRKINLEAFSPKNIFHTIKNLKKKKLVLLITLFLIIIFMLFINTYKNDNFQINTLNHINSREITPQISAYLNKKPYILVSSRDLSDEVKTIHPLVKDATVNKTLFRGILIEIKEYKPLAVIKTTENKKFFYTEENKFVAYREIDQLLPILNYSGNAIYMENSSRFIPNALKFISESEKMNIYGKYTFDNFGNLTVESPSQITIKSDLNERYYSIDEQIKVFQNALEINNFSEIDLRFKDLIIRKKN